MMFCDGNTAEFEYIMSHAPEYKPRQSGVMIAGCEEDIAGVFKDDEKDKMMKRMIAYEIPTRIQCEIKGITDVYSFRDLEHEQRYKEVIYNQIGKKRDRRFEASVFLLTADGALWNEVKDSVRNQVIYFEELEYLSLNKDQYMLYIAARDVYQGKFRLLNIEILANPKVISDEIFTQILIGYLYPTGAISLKGRRND